MAEPCHSACPAGDCAGCAFPPRRVSPTSRDAQLLAQAEQRRQEREFAFEYRSTDEEAA